MTNWLASLDCPSLVPGPYTWPATRLPFIYALLKGTIVSDFEKLNRKYGPVLRTAPDEVTFSQPEAWNLILHVRSGHQEFLKDPTWWRTQPKKPKYLIIDPESHARIRKLLAPGFTPRALRSQEPILNRYVNLLVERLCEYVGENVDEKGTEINVLPWFNFTTFDIFGDLGFGESFDWLQNSRYHPMQQAHFQQIADNVERRLNYELERPDIMFHVIKGSGKGGLSQGEINATFIVLTTAGSETTATALAGTLNYLVQNPDKLRILEAEICTRFRDEREIALDALHNLKAVLNEELRLCLPVAWIFPRRAPVGRDTTRVSIQEYVMDRDPTYFHDASAFRPESCLPEASADSRSLFFAGRLDAVQPFIAGPRSFMGQHIVWVIWTFDFEMIEHELLRWEDLKNFLLVKKKPIKGRMRLRKGEPGQGTL
ncbi:cytochrome P450 [Biscogniauxia sp. FL1348]|nr:cytochrome P450 [Biscogniauxia sp. FL1348]